MRSKYAFLLVVFLICARPCPAQVVPEPTAPNIILRVVDGSTGVPLQGVIVQDRTSGRQISTNQEGVLSLEILGTGTMILELRKEGYRRSVHARSVGQAEEILVELAPTVSEAPTDRSSIEGVVTDAETGTPLEGVLIVCSEPELWTVSGSKGDFSFRGFPTGRLNLILGRLGYAEGEVALETEEGGSIDLRVDLSSDPIVLDPVAVTVDRRTLVEIVDGRTIVGNVDTRSLGAATVISDFGGAQNVGDVLRWNVPGIQVHQDSQGDMSIMIRGLSSLVAQGQPLVIVNGMRVDSARVSWALQDIHPSQIESVEVLRDVASTSVYGMKGAFGVILIKLKRRWPCP